MAGGSFIYIRRINKYNILHFNIFMSCVYVLTSERNSDIKYPKITASLASTSKCGIPMLHVSHQVCLYSSNFQAAEPMSNNITCGLPSTNHRPVNNCFYSFY